MPILDAEQLTGRTRTHVLELAEPSCTLHPDAAAAFVAMRVAATHEHIDLAAASSFRDFNRQLSIWNDKFRGQRPLLDHDGRALQVAGMTAEQIVNAILCWSALPGASRHHWGTEIDVFDRAALPDGVQAQLLPAQFEAGGMFERLGSWLIQHCERFGFFRPYDFDRGGVRPEPWHISYAPISSNALQDLTVELLAETLAVADLAGAAVVQPQIRQIHSRYVCAVARPSALALNARTLNPATRPS